MEDSVDLQRILDAHEHWQSLLNRWFSGDKSVASEASAAEGRLLALIQAIRDERSKATQNK